LQRCGAPASSSSTSRAATISCGASKTDSASGGIVTVPVHGSATVPLGTLHAILKQTGLTADELRRFAD